jgi:uncharacterized DUF497 family protein
VPDFEWDDAKAQSNEEKHGITFADAIAVFADPDAVRLDVSRSEEGEERFKTVGRIDGKLFVVVFTERAGAIRVISGRRANKKEEQAYGDRQSNA